MTSLITLSPVRILDAPRLKAGGICDQKVHEIAAYLRDLISDPTCRYFVATMVDDENQSILAFVGLHHIHQHNLSAEISCVISKHELPCSLEKTADQVGRKILEALFKIAFFSIKLHRVTWTIPVSNSMDGEMAVGSGMRQEAVLEEAFFENGIFVDAGLFAMLASEYPDYGVAFLSFPRGVLSIRGNHTSVEGVRFYHFGDYLEDGYERSVAVRIGVADTSGCLKMQGSDSFLSSSVMLPQEVSEAVRELREYFAKARTKFTIHVEFPYGSAFQRHVWQELQKIPYGATVSYEDIAMTLTGQDKIAARNLSRAVGSACADNPIPILVPCHRVIGKDGRLVGFSGGVENKEFLLEHEIFGYFRAVQ